MKDASVKLIGSRPPLSHAFEPEVRGKAMKPTETSQRGPGCPSRQELEAFGRGTLSDGALDALAGHFAGCPACAAALQALEAGDALLDRLRRPEQADPFSDEPEAMRLEALAEALLPFGRAGSPRLAGLTFLGWVGRGPHGVVYRGEQGRTRQVVAVKVLPGSAPLRPARRRRFLREAALAARVTGSRVLPVLHLGEDRGAVFLVTPWVEGTDLGRIIRGRRALRRGKPGASSHPYVSLADSDYLARLLPVLDQVVTAVAAVHACGLLLRDLKSANCLVGARGEVWLTDFGVDTLARPGGRGTEAKGPAPFLAGPPGLVSPEEWGGRAQPDARTEVFRLGVILYQALTLELPYGIAPLHAGKPLPPAPSQRQSGLPPALDTVMLGSLEPDPARRYASAVEVCAAWERSRGSPGSRCRRGSVADRWHGLWRWVIHRR
jgi:hypothetical protein